MDAGLVVAIVLAVAFVVTNGFHDAANSIAALVATRVATPLQAIMLAAAFNLLGPLLLGAAVANTIGGIVTVPASAADHVIGAGLAAAVTWNLATWRRRAAVKLGAELSSVVSSARPWRRAACTRWTGEGSRGWASSRLCRRLDLSGNLAAAWGARRTAGDPRFCVGWRMGDAAVGRPCSSWAVGGGGGARPSATVPATLQKAVGVISGAAACQRNGLARLSAPDLGRRRSARSDVDRRHGVRGMADQFVAVGPWHLPLPADRGFGVDWRFGRDHLRRLVGGADLPFGVASSVVGVGGGRRRWRHVHWEVVRRWASRG